MRYFGMLVFLGVIACNEKQANPPQAPQSQAPAEPGQQPGATARSRNAEPGSPSDDPADIAVVVASVHDFVGAGVQGTARVDEVISDRGFWLGSGDQRVFAVVREDVPRHEMIDINKGQQIKFTGLVLSRSAIDDLTGQLEADTRQAILSQPAFVAMYWKDVSIME